MEGNGDNRQQLPPVKKEPLRLRSFSSMQQHEQQQLAAAALRLPRGPGQFLPSLQPRVPRLNQPSASPSLPSSSSNGSSNSSSSSSSSSSGSRSTVKFTPNVAIKQETATGTGASPAAAAAGSSSYSVDALLLRSLHTQQPTLQAFSRSVRPKLPFHAAPLQPQQLKPSFLPPIGRAGENAKKQKSKKASRSIGFSDLAHDESQSHLFLPITIPFKLHPRKQHRQQIDCSQQQQKEQQQQQMDDLQGIDTAASTPNHLRRSESPALHINDEHNNFKENTKYEFGEDTAAALLLKGQSAERGQDEYCDEDTRPEFIHICFPELLPALDVAAMQALQAEAQQEAEKKGTEQQNKSSSSSSRASSSANANRRNCPTPFQGLPSGKIGQILIRRSGRVHLRLLTEATRARNAAAAAEAEAAAAAAPEETAAAREAEAEATPKAEEDICYDVRVGTEASFAQEVGCLLPDTNEFIFLGRCFRKLIVTADVQRAVSSLATRR
ncbi:hypothetical protein, conserved [Eimeria brunetti]|uniref:Uncharacterized protein n=1 Tax=Eimeria brunetti TaxID=51314 RepID=U6LLQ3_9EIME|nr:hypothetical protein, conserved [Eimeria brunetti]